MRMTIQWETFMKRSEWRSCSLTIVIFENDDQINFHLTSHEWITKTQDIVTRWLIDWFWKLFHSLKVFDFDDSSWSFFLTRIFSVKLCFLSNFFSQSIRSIASSTLFFSRQIRVGSFFTSNSRRIRQKFSRWISIRTRKRKLCRTKWEEIRFSVENVNFFRLEKIWSSSVVVAKLLEVDWIHRLLYVVYNDRFSSLNGIEILHSASSDYKTFVSINDLTFSNRKTISSINVDPFSGFAPKSNKRKVKFSRSIRFQIFLFVRFLWRAKFFRLSNFSRRNRAQHFSHNEKSRRENVDRLSKFDALRCFVERLSRKLRLEQNSSGNKSFVQISRWKEKFSRKSICRSEIFFVR